MQQARTSQFTQNLRVIRTCFLFFLLALSASFSLVSPSFCEESTSIPNWSAAERHWLKEHHILRVAGPRAFPPFHYIDEAGHVGGMASDYMQLLSKRLGVEIQNQRDLLWPDVLKSAQERTLDLISCAAKTPDRETYLTFTSPYLSFPMVIITRNDMPFISGLNDLQKEKVAIIKNVVTYDWLRRDGIEVEPYFVDSPAEALMAVSTGQADAHVINLAAAGYLIEQYGLTNLKVAAPHPLWKLRSCHGRQKRLA